jgi:hypothetical protein
MQNQTNNSNRQDNKQDNKIRWDIIPPEIKYDRFYYEIINILSQDKTITKVIEIGASSGEGSTEALLIGKIKNEELYSNKIKIFSLEVCSERYIKLQNRYKSVPKFYPLNMSSISVGKFPAKNEIINFYNTITTTLNNYPLGMVLSWYDKDIEYIVKNNIPENGIKYIKDNYNINKFDLALIDGSEFTGLEELNQLWGSKYILLDDINAFKNYNSHKKLKESTEYKCLVEDYTVRNGFSIYKRII